MAANWAQQILAGIGAPATQNNIAKLSAWNQCEGNASGSGLNINNPFNTTLNYGGGKSVNNAGVKHYPSLTAGIQATINTLRSSYYTAIVDNLRHNGSHSSFAAAVGGSPWGTNGSCIASVTGAKLPVTSASGTTPAPVHNTSKITTSAQPQQTQQTQQTQPVQAQTTSFNPGSILNSAGNLINSTGSKVLDWILKTLGIPTPQDILKRLGLVLLGGILIVVGLLVLAGRTAETVINFGSEVGERGSKVGSSAARLGMMAE